MKNFLLFISLVLIVFSCTSGRMKTGRPGRDNAYSGKFAIHDYGDFSILKITNPWQHADGTGFTYILSGGEKKLPDSLKTFPVIKVPVKNVVVFSTTHIGFISALGEQETVTGASGLKYVYDETLRKRIREGRVKEVGYAPAVDYETIIDLHPGLVLLYGLNASVTGIADRLARAGIPSVIIAEYLETHPLGKMEWIKVFGAFYGREKMAAGLFKEAAEKYEKLSRMAKTETEKPGVLLGLPWKDTWYMAGGASFMSRMINDAGGSYLWKDNPSGEYIPLDLETVFMNAFKAGVWLNTGSARSLAEIEARDYRFKNLPVFKNKRIYNNDKRLNDNGGNDYWESGVVHPDLVLADLIKIFHPRLVPEHHFVYYRKLE